nr:hypothetical protein [Mycoplasmopsis cynos]
MLKLKQRHELGDTNTAILNTAPNPLIAPFQYQAWKIIGKTLDFSTNLHMKSEAKPFKEFVYRYSKSFAGVFGFVLLVLLIILALIIPLTTQNPETTNVHNRYLTFNQTDTNNGYHILGTDNLGRDLWARLWHGLRYSLSLAIVVTIIEVVIGLTIGIMMGQFERVDKFFTFFIKVISVVPTILILILMTIVVSPSFWVITFSLSLTSFNWNG